MTLALGELGVCLYYLLRARQTIERFPNPGAEVPPGFDNYAYDRPVPVLVVALLAAVGTIVTSYMANPWAEPDPNRRISPWIPLAVASCGLLVFPGLFSPLYLLIILVVDRFVYRAHFQRRFHR